MSKEIKHNIATTTKEQDFLTGFLEKCPVPLMEDPKSTPDKPLPPIPRYTIDEWLEEWGNQQYQRAYEHGKRSLGAKAATIDKNIFS